MYVCQAKRVIFVTGSAGFVGSNFVLDWLVQSDEPVLDFDKLTYAGNLNNLSSLQDAPRHLFVHGDICDGALVASLLAQYKPRAIVHFVADSHVDRSILGPAAFIETNINGTFSLLEAARAYWRALPDVEKAGFRFCMFPPMRSTAHRGRTMHRLPKPRPTRRTVRIRHQRPPPTVWCAPITTHTVSRR